MQQLRHILSLICARISQFGGSGGCAVKVVTKPARGVAGRWKVVRDRPEPRRRAAVSALAIGLSLWLAGCGSDQSAGTAPAPPAEVAAGEAAEPLPPALTALDLDGLRSRAAQALREQRIHTPAGDSAVDYYLALREREPGQIDVISALSELQPYVVIASEQALLDDDLSESARLLELLARMDPQAPALPRLREGLRVAQATRDRQAREETERLIVERTDASANAAVAQAAQRERSAAAMAASKVEAAASARAADEAAVRAGTAAAPAPSPAATPAAPQASAPAANVRPAPAGAMPRLIADASPRYPLSALNRRIEGSVEISFTIQPDGRTGAATLVSSQPAGVFDDAALAAVARLRFEPSGQVHTARRTLNFKLPSR